MLPPSCALMGAYAVCVRYSEPIIYLPKIDLDNCYYNTLYIACQYNFLVLLKLFCIHIVLVFGVAFFLLEYGFFAPALRCAVHLLLSVCVLYLCYNSLLCNIRGVFSIFSPLPEARKRQVVSSPSHHLKT